MPIDIGRELVTLNKLGLTLGQQRILRDISFTIHANEIITLIGPNGAGKSSLVKILTGLLAPSEGSMNRAPELSYGYVPQRLTMDKSIPLKVSRFLSLAQAAKAESQRALEQVGASHLWSKQMHELSGGEFQRVMLARAISRRPDILILDEPLQGVDVVGQIELYKLIAQIRDTFHCGVFMVSHDLHLVMAQTDRVLCLNQHICCAGKPESVSNHPEYLKLFGQQSAQNIAVYTHHHDHHHNLEGNIEPCDDHCHHD